MIKAAIGFKIFKEAWEFIYRPYPPLLTTAILFCFLAIVSTAFLKVQLLLFISGLPDSVLQKAAAKSREFETTYGKHPKSFRDNLSNQSWVGEMVEFVQKFIDIAANLSCSKSPESNCASALTELQHRAQILL
jgi:hypothetical protein